MCRCRQCRRLRRQLRVCTRWDSFLCLVDACLSGRGVAISIFLVFLCQYRRCHGGTSARPIHHGRFRKRRQHGALATRALELRGQYAARAARWVLSEANGILLAAVHAALVRAARDGLHSLIGPVLHAVVALGVVLGVAAAVGLSLVCVRLGAPQVVLRAVLVIAVDADAVAVLWVPRADADVLRGEVVAVAALLAAVDLELLVIGTVAVVVCEPLVHTVHAAEAVLDAIDDAVAVNRQHAAAHAGAHAAMRLITPVAPLAMRDGAEAKRDPLGLLSFLEPLGLIGPLGAAGPLGPLGPIGPLDPLGPREDPVQLGPLGALGHHCVVAPADLAGLGGETLLADESGGHGVCRWWR